MSTTASRKAKGRKLQQLVRDKILELFPTLTIDDVRSIGMGQSGADIQLSQEAKKLFPYSVECKNQESISIWEALGQAEKNKDGLTPLLIFKRNRSKVYACIELDDLLKLLIKNN